MLLVVPIVKLATALVRPALLEHQQQAVLHASLADISMPEITPVLPAQLIPMVFQEQIVLIVTLPVEDAMEQQQHSAQSAGQGHTCILITILA